MSDIVEWLRDADYKNAPSRCIDAVREIESLRSSLVGMKALHESAVAAWIEAAKQRDALVKALDGIAEYCGGEDTTLGALHLLTSIRNTADQALRGLVGQQPQETPHE